MEQLGLAFAAPPRLARVLSYGGGLDSFAMLVEAIRRGICLDAVVFVDVADPGGEDPGEWPGTYRHIRDVVEPLCAKHGIRFETVDSTRYPVRDARSLFAWMYQRGQIPIAGPNRICTRIAKVERFETWMRDAFGDAPVEVWIGFEAGEEARAAKDPNAGASTQRRNRFPLIEWNLCRCRCEALVRDAGFPVPRKSACVFCPYGSKGDWQTFARELPETFDRVVDLEARKPPTAKNGRKLSIMGYRTIKDAAGNVVEVKAPPLPRFIQGTYRPIARTCDVCGGPRATKATGCDYLDDGDAS